MWRALLSTAGLLVSLEILGLGAAMACVLGLATLLIRRGIRGRLQGVTTWADYLVLTLLLAEVLLGMLVAVNHRWGALWSTGTVMPYVKSVFMLQPNVELVGELPALVKAHLVIAFLIFAFAPFTRLVHALFVPIEYLYRAPQKVVWTSQRRREAVQAQPGGDPDLARRQLVGGVVGAGATATLLGVGVADKMVNYFAQPKLSRDTRTRLLTERHLRVTMTAEERALELERLSNDAILVSGYQELSGKSGKYFIDFEMRPALAFLGPDGLPVLLSAKCTHLGCTVGKDVDDKGRILCPCHVSYFDVKTGVPQADAPAKAPLARLAWVIRDETGKSIASMGADGQLNGTRDREKLSRGNVYVVKADRSEML